MLWIKDRPGENLVVRGARVIDPAGGIDAVLDVRIDAGTIAAVGESVDANGHRVVDGTGLVLAPAFVDPHVHLRTPGREDEETIASGTAAAAAGGYCAILAMPNTDPVVDSAATLGALVETAPPRGGGPGRLPRRDHARPGRGGADGDGRARRRGRGRLLRRRRPGRLGRADAPRAPVRVDDRPPARAPLRGADALARRPRARGRRRGRARLHRLPVGRRVGDGRARPLARGVRGAAGPPAAPLGRRVGRRAPARTRRRRPRERRGDAAPSLPHRRGGALARPEREDESAAPCGVGPPRAARGAPRRDDRGDRDRPRSARAPREGGPVRGGAVRRHRARDRLRRALHAARRDRAALARDAARADVGRAGAGLRHRAAADRRRRDGEPRPARPRPQPGASRRRASARGRPTRGCSARRSRAPLR